MSKRYLPSVTEFGNVPKMEVFADTHMLPEVLIAYLSGEFVNTTRALAPSLLVNPPKSGVLRLFDGDGIHLWPAMNKDRKDLNLRALSMLTEKWLQTGVNGEWLRMINGNHDAYHHIPEKIAREWTKLGILLPTEAAHFTSGEKEFLALHGHQSDPWYFFPKIGMGRYPLPLDFFFSPILDKLDIVFNEKQWKSHQEGESKLPWFFSLLAGASNINLKQYQRNVLDLQWPQATLLAGHTHIPENGHRFVVAEPLEPMLGYVGISIIANGIIKQDRLYAHDLQ